MPAHHGTHRLAQRAVGDAFLDVGLLRIEALGVADGEFALAAPRDLDELVGLVHLHRDRLLEEDVLAGEEAGAGHRVVRRLRGR